MRTDTWPLALAVLLVGCSLGAGEGATNVPAGALPPPQSSLTLQAAASVAVGDALVFDVAGAVPGQTVDLVIGNGGESPDGGPCPAVLGGNCLDILPGQLGIRLFRSGTADTLGSTSIPVQIPSQVRPGPYQFQAIVRAGDDANESNVVEVDITGTAPCGPDAYEPNDTPGSAGLLGSTPLSATLCPQDLIDYYGIVVPADGVLFVDTTTSSSTGDLELELLNGNGLVLDGSYSLGTTEELAWFNSTGRDERVVVRAYSSLVMGDAGIAYDITSTLLVPEPCVDDAQEDDDVPSAAQVAAAGVYTGQSCAGDSDWFAVDVQPDELVTAAVQADSTAGDVALRVYDGAMVELTSDATSDFSYASTTAETLFVEVLLVADDELGGGNAYELEIDRVAAQVCPVDSFEPNDTDAAAVLVAPGTYSGLGACFDTGDDWYAISVNAGDTLTVDVLFLDEDADIDIRLYDPYFNEAARAESGSDDESVSHTALFDGNYLLHVYLWPNTTDGDPATGGALYDLEVQVN